MLKMSRRDTLKQGLSLAGLLALADSVLPVLAQGASWYGPRLGSLRRKPHN